MRILNLKVEKPTVIWEGYLEGGDKRLILVPRPGAKSELTCETQRRDALQEIYWAPYTLSDGELIQVLLDLAVESQKQLENLRRQNKDLRLNVEGKEHYIRNLQAALRKEGLVP